MIVLYSGNLGSGKTLAMSICLYLNYLLGSMAYANYTITGYPVERIKNTFALKSMNKIWKSFALDEFYLDADSRQSGTSKNLAMTRKVLQFRKRHIDTFISSQNIRAIDTRIRDLVGMIVFPETIFSDGYPIYVNCYYSTNKRIHFEDWSLIQKLPCFQLPVVIEETNFNVAENYDTDELVESMDLEEGDIIKELISKYKGFDGSKTDLKSILNMEHGYVAGKASAIGDYIFWVNKLG